MTRKEYAASLHEKKYNCCQSVVCTFADKTDVDERTLYRIAESFGLGMGCMEGTCGALSGAIMLAGLKNSDGDLENPKSKPTTMKLSKEILEKFQKKCGATICKDLKGAETGKMLCSCPDCISNAVDIAEEVLYR